MSLLVWLPLNGNLDNWGSSPAKFSLVTTGGGVATASNGKIVPNCYARTTSNTISHITSDINFTLDGDVTMACWCKLTGYGTTNSANGIITQHGHNTGGLGITMYYASASDYRMSINTGSKGDSFPAADRDRTFYTYYGNTNIYNAWHHLCVTYNASTKQAKLYVDGKLDRDPVNLKGNNTTARPFRLFDWSTDHSNNASYRPPCALNDVRLYDHCLSAKEVKLLAQGLVTHYKFDNNGNTNLLKNSWNFNSTGGNGTVSMDPEGWYKKSYNHPAGSSNYNDFCSWGNAVTVNANEVYTVSFLAKSNNATGNFIVYFYNNGSGVQVSKITSSQGYSGTGTDGACRMNLSTEWKRYWITWQFNGTTTPLAKTLLFRILKEGGQVDIAQVKLEKGPEATPYGLHTSETNFTIADDCSGWGNNGAVSGTFGVSSDTARNSASALLNTSSYITNTRSMDSTNATVALWIKATSYPTSNSIVFADNNSKIAFGFYGTNNLIISCGSGDNSVRTVSNLAAKWTTADWHHVAIVKSGSTYTFYLDGTEWSALGGSYGATNYWTHAPTNQLLINGRHNGSTREYPFSGQIADFRIYCSSLDADDIKFLAKSVGSVTKQGGLLAYELAESSEGDAKINKNGIFAAGGFSERGQLGDMKIITLSDGSSWARVFYHKTNTGATLFTSIDEVMYTTSANKYSRLKLLPYLKGSDGKYEFMLTYPTDAPGKYNRWKQTNAPQDEFVANGDGSAFAAGYQAIHIDWTSYFWGGLTRQGNPASVFSDTYISGSVGHGNWFYAIGAKTKWGNPNGVPGYDGTKGMQEIELWVRVDTLPKNSKFNIMKEQFVSGTLFQEI